MMSIRLEDVALDATYIVPGHVLVEMLQGYINKMSSTTTVDLGPGGGQSGNYETRPNPYTSGVNRQIMEWLKQIEVQSST